MGLMLEGYQVLKALKTSKTVTAVDLGQEDGLTERHTIIREFVELLSSNEKKALANIISADASSKEELISTPVATFPTSMSTHSLPMNVNNPESASQPSPSKRAYELPSFLDVALPPSSTTLEQSQKAPETSPDAGGIPPQSKEGKTLKMSLGGNTGTMPLSHGLQGRSKIVVEGDYKGGCFAIELLDTEEKDIMNHMNFRPHQRKIVTNTYIGSWGEEKYYEGMPLQEGERFKVELTVQAPEEERQPWTLTASANGQHLFSSLLLPNFHSIKKVKVHDKCGHGTANSYESLVVENAPKEALDPPKMEFNERVTPTAPSTDTMMLLGILSSPQNQRQRGSQRRSWLNNEFCTSGKGLVRFFVGKSGNAKIDAMVEEENNKTGDIVILPNHKEDYYNIAGKTAAMVHYAVEIGAKFLLKCDDDTYVDIPQVLEGIKGRGGGLVLAAITYSGAAQRHGKWAMPVSDYPHSRYPPFPHGPGYIIGESILKHADKKLKAGTLRPLALEDVSMGVWIDDAKNSGIHVNYQSRKGGGRGGVNIGGCHAGAMISHYMLPEQMVCMW
eukprot:CAMPEP_0184504328 /NCGR_PEP_ID=MMETSP0113_2-20130426/52408_1 /TAXON_ID=91329 /ORGANISM="Norrisiella sphaerica, Strain BC52" /LENGTH=558 /DNA_ID=CAMNT_0026893969 /DNA_START=187 /DNA_END=1860 /DNA_ORIENTATION=+